LGNGKVIYKIYLLLDLDLTLSTSEKNNVVVHCSAGVGRTGTFIALYKLMDWIDSTPNIEKVDIFNEVLLLRKNRCNMVRNHF